MKKFIAIALLTFIAGKGFAQGLTLPPSGDNQKASVIQNIGPVTVTINYSSPNVHAPNGTDRKGHIWGELVHYGFIDQGFGPAKAAPWRAGSNENTTITFSHDVKIGGKDLKAGTYGLFLDVEKDGLWTWIFSNNSKSWGSYYYNQGEDALRIQAAPQDAAYTEFLTYGFDDREANAAVAYLQWENKKIPFKIEVPNVNDLYVGIIRNELRGNVGFDYKNIMAAAQFCARNKINLEEALVWADAAINPPLGTEEFGSLQTKAMVLRAMNKNDEAETVMAKAINHPTASVQGIHQYARTLLSEGKKEKALEVFKLNRQRHPEDTFTTYVGLARGFTAVGDTKNAIKNWETAIKNIPENQKPNLAAYEAELKKLKGGV
jgi:tetratricopeptide (TPR) repeat protein